MHSVSVCIQKFAKRFAVIKEIKIANFEED